MRGGVAVGLALVAIGGAAPVGAVDQLVAGRRLVLRQHAGAERLVLVVRDALVLPTPGTTDDPAAACSARASR